MTPRKSLRAAAPCAAAAEAPAQAKAEAAARAAALRSAREEACRLRALGVLTAALADLGKVRAHLARRARSHTAAARTGYFTPPGIYVERPPQPAARDAAGARATRLAAGIELAILRSIAALILRHS